MKKKIINLSFVFVFAVLFLLAGCTSGGSSSEFSGVKATVFKSASCGCCVGYTAQMNERGFDVETVNVADMGSVKAEHNIPTGLSSCHTVVIGDYFVEGHVPFEAVEKLLTEKPNIDGITLPNMPAGSPGMPGTKSGSWVIYQLKDGHATEFMTI